MKITKRQLRSIVKEASSDDWENRRSRWAKFKHHMAREPQLYLDWVEKNGHVTSAASSVMATYFLEMGLENEHKIHKKLASEIGLDHKDVMRDLKMQQSERSINMGESKTKIAKRQLRSIRESRADDEVDRGWQDFHNGLERDPNGSVWYQDGYDEAKENAVKRGHGDTPRAMREASRVKIIKRQLRRIIKEEKARLLNEIAPDDPYASVGGPDPSPKRGPKIATAMGQTAKSDALFDARDNLLGLIETLDPAEFDSYIDSLIAELEMMKQGV